jgi:hypothetical protein
MVWSNMQVGGGKERKKCEKMMAQRKFNHITWLAMRSRIHCNNFELSDSYARVGGSTCRKRTGNSGRK